MEPPRRLAAPPLRRGIVLRPRLSRALDSGGASALTLVVAPTGYGKTVAVEGWSVERGLATAWVRADSRDDDPVRLWTSLTTAVERVRPGAGGDAPAHLRNPAGAVLPAIEALAIGLSADERPIVLAIDEVQSIREARCLRSLDDAVASLPEHVQLVLISRTVPALRLARLRTQGRLVEVGADELAFTPAEARELFAAVPGVTADEPTIAALTRTTEGWAGVLYLAALWLRKRDDPAEALRTFRGSQRDVAGYLAGEALGDLDADARRFLRRTAVLPQLYGELCDAVLGESGSRERLRALARANLLVMPLVERPGWYRCHALLRDHLLGEVDRADAVAVRERALIWSHAHGLIEDAAEYARAAGDVGALLGLIDDHTLALMRSGRSRTIVRWVTAIPRSVLLAQPGALVAGIGAAHVSGRPPAEIRRLLVLARETDPYVVTRNEGAMLQIVRALYRDDHVGEALHEAQTAVELARADGELLVPALGLRAVLRLLAGDEPGAARDARAAIEHPDAAIRPLGLIAAAAALAILDARAGRRHSARAHADLRASGDAQGRVARPPGGSAGADRGRGHRGAGGPAVRGPPLRPAGRVGGDRRRPLAGLGAARAGPDRLSAGPPAGRPGSAGPCRGAARRGPRRGRPARVRLRAASRTATPAHREGRPSRSRRPSSRCCGCCHAGQCAKWPRRSTSPRTRSSHTSARSTANSVSTAARTRSRARSRSGCSMTP